MYKPNYRSQLLHHTAVADLKFVLLIVAAESKIKFATLISFPDSKITTMRSILISVYHRSLKWAYTIPFNTEDPSVYIPDFQEDVFSSRGYLITLADVSFTWMIWRKSLAMVQKTELPIPKVRKIIPEIVARWNRSKGRKDEMTYHLDGMSFPFIIGLSNQQLVMRELKIIAVNVKFVLKHCFPERHPQVGKC